MGASVPLTEEAVKKYLDDAIRLWRGRRQTAEQNQDVEAHKMARYYVDAFQSVRTSLFDELLPRDG